MHHTLGSLEAGFNPTSLKDIHSEEFERTEHYETNFQKSTDMLGELSKMFKFSRKLSAADEFDFTNLKEEKEELGPRKQMITGDVRLPSYYNVREAYSECRPKILDQGICGACWAFAASGILSDRFCMHSQGQIQVTLSA